MKPVIRTRRIRAAYAARRLSMRRSLAWSMALTPTRRAIRMPTLRMPKSVTAIMTSMSVMPD